MVHCGGSADSKLHTTRKPPSGAALALCAPVQTQAQELPDFSTLTQQWLDQALQQQAPSEGAGLRMEVIVGQLDSRLRLTPCARVEPYLPAGSRLWGRTRLGLRCLEGASRWNVFLPITVKAWGPAWVMAANVAPGKTLTASDAVLEEVDWAAENAAVVANQEAWVGQVAARQLLSGQALRQTMVRAPELFRSGAQVRVIVQGQGYVVTAAGQAMGAGSAGQSVRVRMDNGRIISGTVTPEGAVQVAM